MERLSLKSLSVNKILLAGFIFSLFFSVRHVFSSEAGFFTGAYSDFTSISLYLSDILLFGLLAWNARSLFTKQVIYSLIVTIVILLLEVFFNKEYLSLRIFFAVKILELVLVFLLFRVQQIRQDFIKLLPLFVIFGAAQGLIALLQFTIQSSVGLYLFGESHLGPEMLNVAKVVTRGTKFIRGYGTFPHSNLLSAYLVVGIMFNIYLLYKTTHKLTKLAYSITLFAQNLGLVIALSRIGFLAILISSCVWLGFILLKDGISKRTTWIFAVLLISIGTALAIFSPYLIPRATINDPAAKERWFYNRVGIDMILDKPYFGTGPGVSVLHMEQYSPVPLEAWQKQPIHNYYLLLIAEFGLFISLFILGLIIYLIFKLGKVLIKSVPNSILWAYRLILLSIACGFVILMAFDHYFYTIQQTQLLFWVILGLIAGEIIKNSSNNKLLNKV
jgi:hypothetical protein